MFVVCLELIDGLYQPLAWSGERPSRKLVRRAVRKFMTDRDVVKSVILDWRRMYSDQSELKKLPRI